MNRSVFENYIQSLCEDLSIKDNPYAHRQRHACVITYNDAVISTAININLKHDFTKRYNNLKGLHSEALAIMRAIHKHHSILHKSELWVCRAGKTKDSCKYSRPCPMCMKIIKTFHIPIIHYTLDDGSWKMETLS